MHSEVLSVDLLGCYTVQYSKQIFIIVDSVVFVHLVKKDNWS